jgi:23S rRNA A1618 N6-methylase RlmF
LFTPHSLFSGTGASAIYPLIACRLSPNWHFVATGQSKSLSVFSPFIQVIDIDSVSLLSAQSNIDSNGLSERIALIRADPTGPIMIPLIQDAAASCATHHVMPFPQLIPHTDLIFACATRPSMQAKNNLHTRQLQKHSHPMLSVLLVVIIFRLL